ncbi:MAG: NAD(P)/FAD-dependent oxidoreductase [Blautia sp.]|nr:NAD(P)/FAD-dependent oxidoreductase [Blautia sp.]
MERVDVLVIGAGLLGCFTARNLTRYEMDILVLEKENDVSRGISKANTGIIYTGYDNKPGSLKSKLCIQSNEAFDALARQLAVPFSRPGSLMIGYGPRADQVIRRKYTDGIRAGIKGLRLLNGCEAKELEPRLADGISSALFSRSTGTVNPWELCIAAYENARDNGAGFQFGSEVHSIKRDHGAFLVETDSGLYSARAVVNAAGLSSDRVREFIQKPLLRLYPTAADYMVLDTSESGKIRHIIFHEGENGKGLTLVPTVDGNILVGPTNHEPKYGVISDTGFRVSTDGLMELRSLCRMVAPSILTEKQIRAFGSLRPNVYRVHEEEGRIIREDTRIRDFSLLEEDGFFSLIGIKTPGLTFSNELGRLAADKAAAFTGRTKLRKSYSPYRVGIARTRDLSAGERAALIRKDPCRGEVVCGCMDVTLSEILQAIEQGAHDFEGIRRRTGAGMGRCQGSRCRKKIWDCLYERSFREKH